ncbi:MAG TPA: hypothetical protein VMN39_06565, partial [Longimicrobiaceae bacterium]|nr:hypothetical protein [Longimicrobiaceae bacterium]
LNFNISYRPTDAHEIQLGPSVGWNHTTAQFVSSIADPTATHTYGRRYLFAPLDQTTVSMSTRVNMTFSPTLTLEIYAEPFISTGRYATPGELAAPRTYEFRTYGTDIGTATRGDDGRYTIDPDGPGPASARTVRDPDFNFHSLLGNAVLRWEWRPGSTLFFVWQQARNERLSTADVLLDRRIGDFDFEKDARALFGIKPENIFMVKVNYWLNP